MRQTYSCIKGLCWEIAIILSLKKKNISLTNYTRLSVYLFTTFEFRFSKAIIFPLRLCRLNERTRGKIQRKMNWKQATRSHGLCSCAMWQMFPESAEECNLPPRWAGCSWQNPGSSYFPWDLEKRKFEKRRFLIAIQTILIPDDFYLLYIDF